ncbi:type IV pilus biogenesis protein PilM [Alicyclobacillus macrosporangiidus]|uniref:Tfp pilus assembly protein, ATPase PilM n=1 Tax=Alicyclobacillus macrosporangiidus TaxID=392015 RepID=A0A1I7JW69_9BACL|nr:pilus assembly protein PilM [Alicyclobacillus macrosporangiidus]SFU89319.1 Tfp pilus assembly protein, ATPase PilM [Alicyclobacillus macrosporangiidus]
MKLSLHFQKNRKLTVGLEFANSGLRAAALAPSRSGPKVAAATAVSAAVDDWWDAPEAEEVREQLDSFVKHHELKGCAAVLNVPSERTILRYLQLPPLPDKVLRNTVQMELGVSIHLPFDDPTFDVVRVPPLNPDLPQGGAETASCCLVAAPRSLVDHLVHLVADVGLHPVAVDVVPLALRRVSRPAELPDDGLNVCVYMDARDITIAVFVGDFMYFVRTVPYLLRDEADGFTMSGYARDLGSEIERVVNFFNYNLSPVERPLAAIQLHSVAAEVDPVIELLGQRFGCPVYRVQRDVAWPPEVAPDLLSVFYPAVGLAMKERAKS